MFFLWTVIVLNYSKIIFPIICWAKNFPGELFAVSCLTEKTHFWWTFLCWSANAVNCWWRWPAEISGFSFLVNFNLLTYIQCNLFGLNYLWWTLQSGLCGENSSSLINGDEVRWIVSSGKNYTQKTMSSNLRQPKHTPYVFKKTVESKILY
jgi:hypothetical protein